jgi:class 3 adenylate cyclase
MMKPSVTGVTDALLVFADIIDSSKFSSVLGFLDYANKLRNFRDLFKIIARRYFPEPEDKNLRFVEIDARGDEGIIFCISPSMQEQRANLFTAIEFLYHLKGLLHFGIKVDGSEEPQLISPKRIELGAGIHVGRVAYATVLKENHKEIFQIDGFAINKAKRIETASRLGKYSKIMLSKEAAKLLEAEPILLSHVRSPMKGIEEQADLYEVESGLFENIKIQTKNPIEDHVDNELLKYIKDKAEKPYSIDEDWLKSLIISILDILIIREQAILSPDREQYQNQQFNIAWNSSIESDPILLYLRARYYEKKGKYTQQIRHLKQLIDKYPEFIFARKRMVKACWQIAQRAEERAEKIYARDIAEELLDNYPHLLSAEEKRDYAEIIEAANPKKEAGQ